MKQFYFYDILLKLYRLQCEYVCSFNHIFAQFIALNLHDLFLHSELKLFIVDTFYCNFLLDNAYVCFVLLRQQLIR